MINFRIVPLALIYGVEAIATLLAVEEAPHDTRDPVRNNVPLQPTIKQLSDPI
jgi:hypothetical protein